MDGFGGTPGTNPNKMQPTDLGYVGTDLSGEHPIEVTYDTNLSNNDGGLHNPSVALSGLTPAGTIADDMLFSDVLGCASCHDVHDSATLPFMLRKTNAGSALCLTCHDK
jgi:predicted CXXCH cytochrome family protein